MQTFVLTRHEDILGICRELAEAGLTTNREFDTTSELEKLCDDELAAGLLVTDLSHAEELDLELTARLTAQSVRMLVHSQELPACSFLQHCGQTGMEPVIGPAGLVLQRRIQDCLRVETLVQEAAQCTRKMQQIAQTLEAPDQDLDFLRQKIQFLDMQREKLSSVLETMNMLSRLSQEISTLDLDEIINVCVTKIPLLVNARYASFYVHDCDTRLLRLKRHNHGYRIDDVVKVDKETTSAMVRALLERRILLVRDFDEYERLHNVHVEHPYSERYSSKSCIIVPMLAGDRVVAVLNLADKRNGTFFDEVNDLPPMEQLSVLVGAAIRNYQLFQEVRNQARTDSMTGFINHQAFFEELEREMLRVRRYQGALSLIMTDVDNFKLFNDLYGHQVGDFILKETARVIRLNVRDTDVPARYGGDEFAVILSQTDLEHARMVAERIRQTVDSQTFTCEDKVLSLSLSIGVAQYEPGMSVTEFVGEVDKALYLAKDRGRNRVAVAGTQSSA